MARDHEIVRVKGWDLDHFRKNPVILWGHDPHGLPIGKATDIRQIVHGDNKRLEGDIEFAGLEQMHDLAESVYLLARDGFINATSVGFMPKKYRELDEDEKKELGLHPVYGAECIEQELYEVSVVTVPADTGCLIQAAAERPEVRDAVLAVRAALPEEERDEWPDLTWRAEVTARLDAVEEEVRQARIDREADRGSSRQSEPSERGSPNLATAKAPDAKQTEDRFERLANELDRRLT